MFEKPLGPFPEDAQDKPRGVSISFHPWMARYKLSLLGEIDKY
jgi:hypothetical protein